MDPNETLRLLRLMADLADGTQELAPGESLHWDDFAELFKSLDEWLTRGGAKPEAWNLLVTPAYPLSPIETE